MNKREFLFFSTFSLAMVGAIVEPFNLFSNFNVGDVLFIFVCITLLPIHSYRVNYLTILPIVILLFSVLSIFVNLIIGNDYEYNFGTPFRLLYYIFIIIIISNFIDTDEKEHYLWWSVLVGLSLTCLLVYFEWMKTPIYLGSIPMFHTVHNFDSFPINRNYLGFFSAIAIAISVGLISVEKYKVRKIILVFITVAISLMSIFTFSKGTWLASFLGVIIYYLLYKKNKKNKIILLIFFVIVVMIFSAVYQEYLNEILEQVQRRISSSDSTNHERVEYIYLSFDVVNLNPIFGVGTGAFESALKSINAQYLTKDPHNALLWIFSENGLISLASFLVMLSYIFWSCLFSKSKFRDLYFLLLLSLVFTMPTQGTSYTMKYLWVLFGICISMKRIRRREYGKFN
ncbi:O-antigen ligase family protein [Vibrio splendidus]|uniref:O-antigen ligase family protein n=1 Tax=Vibrio splendidus TaxID=29497 RepID=UPI0011B3BF66|nr:O-antigen ligase family protein [Vibrio splendidus]